MQKLTGIFLVVGLLFSGCSVADPKAEADQLYKQGCIEFRVGYEKLITKKIIYVPAKAKEFFRKAAAKNPDFEQYYFDVSPLSEKPKSQSDYTPDQLMNLLKIMQKCDVVNEKLK